MSKDFYRKNKFFLLLVLILLLPLSSFADSSVSAGFMDTLYNDILGQTSTYQTVFEPAARSLLISLSIGEFVWDTSIRVLKGADSTKILAFVMVRIVSVSIVIYFIDHPDWIQNIIEQGKEWAAQAGGVPANITPSKIAGVGIDATVNMIMAVNQDNSGIWSGVGNLIQAFVITTAAYTIVILFVLIAMQYLLTLVESTLVISVGFVMLGFLGSAWTREFGKRYISFIIAVSIKLMVTILICAVVMRESQGWSSLINQTTGDLGSLVNAGLQMILDGIVLLVLVRSIPTYAAGIISGIASSDASGMISSSLTIAASGLASAASSMSLLNSAMSGGGGSRAVLGSAQALENAFVGSDAARGGANENLSPNNGSNAGPSPDLSSTVEGPSPGEKQNLPNSSGSSSSDSVSGSISGNAR